MRKIKSWNLFESLIVSPAINDLIYDLVKEGDEVAEFLDAVRSMDEFYQDNEDLNFLELSEEVNKISFMPLRRRTNAEWFRNFDPKSMPTRIGKVVRKILEKTKKFLVYSGKHEAVVLSFQSNRNEIRLDFPGYRLPYIKTESKATVEITVNGYWTSDGLKKLSEPVTVRDITLDDEDWNHRMGTWYGLDTEESSVRVYQLFANCTELIEKLKELELWKPFSDRSENLDTEITIHSNIQINDKAIEDFVNRAMAWIKLNRAPDDAVIEEVRGEDIRKWYLRTNYYRVGDKEPSGDLGNSCMSYAKCQPYLDIYCANPEVVSLLILRKKAEDGTAKLLGRALLWKMVDGSFFMDRVYCSLDSDSYLFYNKANENNWLYKIKGYFLLANQTVEKAVLKVKLKECRFEKYPYLDTLTYLDETECTLSFECVRGSMKLVSTSGEWIDSECDDDDY